MSTNTDTFDKVFGQVFERLCSRPPRMRASDFDSASEISEGEDLGQCHGLETQAIEPETESSPWEFLDIPTI